MSRPTPKVILRNASAYLKEHPEEIWRAVRGLVGLRFGVPIDALRYLAREFGGGKRAPKDVIIDSAPPGIRLGATVDAMGTTLRIGLVLYVEELEVTQETIRIGTRIGDMSLDVLSNHDSPLAGLVKSGALDLSKPGNLVNIMPKRPAALIDAKDDRVVFDLMKVPRLASNPRVRRALAVLTPVVGVHAIRTKDDHLDVHLKTDLSGVPAAFAAVRNGV